ncbi:NAD(P)-dependent oxidoreductase [Sphingomonas sp. Leaf339]|uniref:NAD(P)-dependent oxidoreductase n=1 Tax=Sphingomonas sp. Leaf339 TaxID=1736343 RepID=UPI0009EA5A42|nr:NAD(P)-dependent oxidoreductase [Sphingomonas sp. Leaf339]
MTVRKVAMLGLGIMGGGMARQLLDAGFELTVWNRSPGKSDALVAAGARLADSPAAAVREVDVAVAMLASDDASRAVWLDGGTLGALRPGAILIEASTLTIDWVRTLAAAAAEAGIGFLDAPVTGSKAQAASGQLRFLVGGDADVAAAASPVLAAMGGETVHLGSTGSGTILKLVNNFLCGVQVASLAEAVAMIERSGLDVERSVALLASGAPGSPLVGAVSRRMVDRAYQPQFLVPLMAKDLSYAEAAFAGQGIDLPSSAAARARFEAAAADHAERDIAAVVESIRSS